PNLDVEKIAQHIALEKAKAVKTYVGEAFHHQYTHQPILAADTIVVLDDLVIGKPENKEQAIETLQKLQGREHRVITGVAILFEEATHVFADVTKVHFHALTNEQIEHYVSKYQPYDKAGAYAIQEWIGVVGIAGIEGDFYNVMGLPISRVVQTLQQLNY
ncbi:MAG: Maf family protein, partial [Chitinophagaceae bacterium]